VRFGEIIEGGSAGGSEGGVATYLRCGGVVNNQIKKGLLLSLRVKKILKSGNIWQSYKQERDCLVHLCA